MVDDNAPCIRFCVRIDPVPKGRPRFFRRGKFMGTYTPTRTKAFESELFDLCRKHIPPKPLTGPISLEIIFFIRRSNNNGTRFCDKRPDLDNLVKAATDVFNTYFWKDDGQIVKLSAMKVYDMESGIYFKIQEIGHESVPCVQLPEKKHNNTPVQGNGG